MSEEKKSLEHNKQMVDKFLEEKKYSFAEMVPGDYGLEFLEFMKQQGIADSFASAEYKKSRSFISNYEIFPMIYMMNILSGEWSVRRTEILLRNEAMLRIMGFSEKQIDEGLTKRGSKNQYGEGFPRKSGIMASTTVIDNLACFTYPGLLECFNIHVRRISIQIDLGEVFILDSTIVETRENYPGAMPTRRKNENGDDTSELIWGFKVFILSSAKTRMPVAMHITTANVADSPMLLDMVKRGVANLGEGKIKVVLADRGFVDGRQMYQLKYEMGIDFVIPAKKSMEIWKCVTGLRKDNRDNIEEWKYGKKGLSGGYLTKGSVSYSQYAEKPAGNSKEQNGMPINAVVVTRWAGMEISEGKEKVMLTSLETDSAIEIIKLYGERTLIENCNFRELKQAAALKDLPQIKNENADKTAIIHMLLCVFSLTVFLALVYTVYNGTPKAKEKIPKNIREFRFTKKCEKIKMFILVKHYYHIYDMNEFMKLAGFDITKDT